MDCRLSPLFLNSWRNSVATRSGNIGRIRGNWRRSPGERNAVFRSGCPRRQKKKAWCGIKFMASRSCALFNPLVSTSVSARTKSNSACLSLSCRVSQLSTSIFIRKRLANYIYPSPAGVVMMSSPSIDISRADCDSELIQKSGQPPALV